MSEMARLITADVEIHALPDRLQVAVGPVLRQTGWRGGLWVRYIPPVGVDDFLVEVSDGNQVAGYLIFNSEEYGNFMQGGGGNPGASVENYLGIQKRTESWASGASVVTMANGGGRAYFRVFETIALNAGGVRAGGPITYTLNEDLKVSENGLLCNDSDVNLAAAGVTAPHVVGICSGVPNINRNNNRLCLDQKY